MNRHAAGFGRRVRRIARSAALFVYVSALAIFLAVALRRARLQHLLRWLTPSRSIWKDPQVVSDAARCCRFTLWKRLYPSGGVCLPRALILYHLAMQTGLAPRFHVGVRHRDHELESHAWVEVDGAPIFEPPKANLPYRSMFAFPLISGR